MLLITPLIGVHGFTNLFSVYAQVDNGEGHTSERCRAQAMLSQSMEATTMHNIMGDFDGMVGSCGFARKDTYA